jgi:hypothetical protein
MAMIFYFSSESNPLPELTAAVWDKALHFVEYAGLAALLGRAFWRRDLARRAFLAAVVVASLYAASDEVHQMWVPGRDRRFATGSPARSAAWQALPCTHGGLGRRGRSPASECHEQLKPRFGPLLRLLVVLHRAEHVAVGILKEHQGADADEWTSASPFSRRRQHRLRRLVDRWDRDRALEPDSPLTGHEPRRRCSPMTPGSSPVPFV